MVEPRVEVALVVAIRDGRVLVARREDRLHLGGLWEFPGGKVEPGEDPASAARRELAEETGLVAFELSPLITAVHDYPERSVRLHAFVATDLTGELCPAAADRAIWVRPERLTGLGMPAANRAILEAIACVFDQTPQATGDSTDSSSSATNRPTSSGLRRSASAPSRSTADSTDPTP